MTQKPFFLIPTNFPSLLTETIQNYNSQYHTDFCLDDFITDEVNFAKISYSNASAEHIFRLGKWVGVEEFKKQNNYYPPRQSSFK